MTEIGLAELAACGVVVPVAVAFLEELVLCGPGIVNQAWILS